MSWASFEVRVPGKWVLAGEHAVLRGAPSVTLPHPELGLSLRFEPSDATELEIQPPEARAVVGELLVAALQGLPAPRGRLTVASTIPFGAGLGSSAALCVAVTRWLAGPLSLPSAEWAPFATRLEHGFHGRSSGMDVAAILACEPVSYVRGRGAEPLGVTRLPRFTLHDTGLRARTSDCIAKVAALRERDPERAARADEGMAAASREAIDGLKAYDRGDARDGLDLLARSMRRAQDCYEAWELVPGEVRALQQSLLAQGALATKLTGAGGGGMLVALWGG